MSIIQRSGTAAPATSSVRRQRSRAGAGAALATLLLVLLPAPASAVDTFATLETELCKDGGAEVEVTGNITATSSVLTVANNCIATLDLNGKEVKVQSVGLGTGADLTIKDSAGGGELIADATTGSSSAAGIRTTGATLTIESGTVTAKGEIAAGIGGGTSGDGGTVTISGGTVTAIGGNNRAGIGGGFLGDGGTVTISGGTVIATGGAAGAGIGGGTSGDGGTVTISGGTVTATGGESSGDGAAGIGGGMNGDGGTVAISGGTVTATAGSGSAAPIGPGTRGDTGTVTVGPSAIDSTVGLVRSISFPAPAASPVSSLRVVCGEDAVSVGATVTCRVTGGDPGIDILWRAAYNPVIAEAGVTLDASGSGTFSFTVPAAALGQELTVELVEWIAPVSLGVVSGPVPGSVPAGEGPVPVWTLGLLALVGVGLLRRGMRVEA